MIKPDMIPDEVVRALKQCLNGCDCDECLAVCIAAAINAWPGAFQTTTQINRDATEVLIFPLPTEKLE